MQAPQFLDLLAPRISTGVGSNIGLHLHLRGLAHAAPVSTQFPTTAVGARSVFCPRLLNGVVVDKVRARVQFFVSKWFVGRRLG